MISPLVVLSLAVSLSGEGAAISWQEFSPAIFTRAQAEKKLVLLDLGAVWCHWCHVMERTTYEDAKVVALVKQGYIAVRVDQDSRPDLANRYEDYGWPATIIFNAKGAELAKMRGYIEPERMASLLKAFIDDPTPGPSVTKKAVPVTPAEKQLSGETRDLLVKKLVDGYDRTQGGWGTVHKYLPADNVEYALGADESVKAMARETLDKQLALIDPVWGGVYQYSHGGVWENPHFEKIMAMQADDLRIYALASQVFAKPEYLAAARAIYRYLITFLRSKDGAFFTSQDADVIQGEHAGDYFALDDAGRRKLGIPRIDQHIYARENGWAIEALCQLYATGEDQDALKQAETAARWILEHRSLEGGGFRHDEKDVAGPYLGDTLAMGRAFLALYVVTAERPWLARAADCAGYIARTFDDGTPGIPTTKPSSNMPVNWSVDRQLEENIAVARWAGLLHRYTGNPAHRALAEAAMRYIASADVARARGFATGGILLADRELSSDPVHVTIVGPKRDLRARKLFRAAIAHPVQCKRVEWFDPTEGPLPNADVEYPVLKEPAAFLCANGACSAPISGAVKLGETLAGKR